MLIIQTSNVVGDIFIGLVLRKSNIPVLCRDIAELTISQVCGVVVGQEEKPTPKPM